MRRLDSVPPRHQPSPSLGVSASDSRTSGTANRPGLREPVASVAPDRTLTSPAAEADREVWGAGECDTVSESSGLRSASLAARVRILRERLDLATPLVCTTVTLPVERLVVPNDAQLGRRGRPFGVNIGLVGMLHPPAVVSLPGTDTFRVVTGRGRVIGARLLGEPAALECHRYERLTRKEESLLVLSENLRRAPAWVQEVEALAQLIADGVGLAEAEVGYLLGLPISTVRERLKLASLPPALLAQLTRGDISQDLARRIARLNAAERAALEERAEDGEDITEALVKQALHGQIGAGMAPVRQTLDTSWSPWERATNWQEAAQVQAATGIDNPTEQALVTTATGMSTWEAATRERYGASVHDEEAHRVDGAVDGATGSARWCQVDLHRLIAELQCLERKLLSEPGTARACVLTQALTQELAVLVRELPGSTQACDR